MTTIDSPAPFSCQTSPGLPELLAGLNCSLVLSTYQAGKVIFLSPYQGGLIQLPRTFDKPMGLAADGGRLAVAARQEVVLLANAPHLAAGYPPAPGQYDGLYLPRAVYFCGELDLHDMAWHGQTLWAVNTRFSCLCTLDVNFSFTPRWAPPFITDLTDEDRCHLNGMALADGRPLYVTALGATNTARGWRANKVGGGVLLHVPSGEVVVTGLPMPHSPRLVDGRLYWLNSASGELVQGDPDRGTFETVTRLPAFVRGLVYYQDYLFIGLSRLRWDRPLGDIPLAQQELVSGLAVVHLPSGRVVEQLHYQNSCEEIYDVQVLPGQRRPGIVSPDQPLHRSALATPQYGFWARPDSAEPS